MTAHGFVDKRQHFTLPSSWPLWPMLSATIRSGALAIRDSAGKLHEFGDGTGVPVTVHFLDHGIEWALLNDPQLAIGEGYMQGRITVEMGTLYDLLALLARNLQKHSFPVIMQLTDRFRRFTRLRRQRNRPFQAKRNVSRHYDLPPSLYELFLDPDRQYSCAYFPAGNETLGEAQLAKKQHIAAKLRLEPGQKVLDIGSGWGGLALHLAKTAGVEVTGITLSEEQVRYARQREPGNTAVTFSLKDYRSLDKTYDRIVSVGMFEHVGLPNYPAFFKKLHGALKEDGIALLHTIGSLGGPHGTNPFIEKYIFPGGYVPSLSEIVPSIEASGLLVTDIEVLRLHYAKTLAAWRQNFTSAWKRAAGLLSEEFCRMWEFYLTGCEVAFRYHNLCVFQIQLAKRIDALPITRNYMLEA